jgi:hypothetical protein
LRKEWDDLAAKNPDRLSVKYVLDKEPRGWKGEFLPLVKTTVAEL